jgi:membrane-bound lytic murein transglycosylase A
MVVLVALTLASCKRREVPPPEPAATLESLTFASLPGWADDDHAAALTAFLRSCGRLAAQPAERAMGREPWAGRIGDWQPACEAAKGAATTARTFLEQWFQPFRLTDRGRPDGLFTGYYEPLLDGSLTSDARFTVPLYKRPADLVSVDLGQFDPELQGRRIAGKVASGKLVPYAPRAEIVRGALAGQGLELLWVDDPVAAFFLEIQGSGQIRLTDGSTLRVGYADQNGQPYRAIGKDLVELGALDRGKVSLQAIRAWLAAHPDRAPEILDRNRSYVFFRSLPQLAQTPGPLGAQNVPLTPGRSLAVDRRFVPLGVPLWLDTTAPMPDGERPLRRLVIAQDTGGAIRGVVRGDVFWGAGAEAEHTAGHMQSRGRLYILLPRTLTPTS